MEDPVASDLVLIDPWGTPYVARENESRAVKQPWIRRAEFMDLYSCGPNGRDDTADPRPDVESDDIGNW